MVAVPGQVRLLIAADVRRCGLPGGHVACTVTQATWIAADLPAASLAGAAAPGRPAPADAAGLDRLRDFAVAGHHFYSETADLTRPFPSAAAVLDYDPEYVWNQWLAAPFEAAGLRAWCAVLLQVAPARTRTRSPAAPPPPPAAPRVVRRARARF